MTALLEAAVLAPSASNKQPWRFLVVQSPERIAQMAAAVREATARIASHIPRRPPRRPDRRAPAGDLAHGGVAITLTAFIAKA